MPHWIWTVIAMAILGTAVGLLVPRLRRCAQRGLYVDDVFNASTRSRGPSPHGLSQAWGGAAGAVISDDGELRRRSAVLVDGRLESPQPRKPRRGELTRLDPWAQVWTAVFTDGLRVELAVAPGDAHHVGPWQQPRS